MSKYETGKNYIPVMYAFLPISIKGNALWSNYGITECGCPNELITYINKLKEYCGVDEVQIQYDSKYNAFTFFVLAPLNSQKLMIQRCEGFNYVYGKNNKHPFKEIFYPFGSNNVNINWENVVADRISKLNSYFSNSCFNEGIYSLCGIDFYLNSDTKQIKGYVNFEVARNSFMTNNILSLVGSIETQQGVNIGDFNSIMVVDDEMITISSNITVSEYKKDIDLKELCDPYFSVCPNSSKDKITIQCTEYFRIIANGTKLLQYCENSDCFEIYDLPSNWSIQDGLTNLKQAKCFDCINRDTDDPVLKEVYSILEARKNKTLALKKAATI